MSDQVLSLGSRILAKYWGPDGLSWLLLLGTICCAAIVTFRQQLNAVRSVRGFISYALPSSQFRHPSARADLIFWVLRRVTSPLLLAPMAITAATTGYAVNAGLSYVTGLGHASSPGVSPVVMILFTITMLIAYDLSYYIYHYLQHKVPFMWQLHAVHHSAEVLVGLTKDRIHPLDQIMNNLWDGVIPGVAYGLWMFVALDPAEVLVFGINVYVLRNILMMDFVRHTHFPFSYGRVLDRIILCPHAHQLHHSKAPQHFDRNFGLMLCVWDRLFGTMVDPKPGETFVFGIDDKDGEYHSLFGLYVLPLIRMARALVPRRYKQGTASAAKTSDLDGTAAL